MHIAFLTPEYPHENISHSGGMGTSIRNLANALVQKGHQITVFVYGQKSDQVFKDQGIQFHLIAQKKYSLAGFYWYRKHIQNYVNQHSESIDLLEAPDWTGITAFMNLNLPLVIRFHGSDTYFCHIEKRPQKWKNQFFEKNAVSKAKAYIAPTHFAGEESMKLFQQPVERLQVIHYGLDLNQFQNEKVKEYTPYALLNIGTLIRKKGVFQLVEMFEKVLEQFPVATLTFIGGDSNDLKTGNSSTWELMQKSFSPLAKKQITYLGKIPYDQVQEEIKKAHVCVFPSLAETLGMVTIESMALGKAVVNTNIGWALDLIQHGHDGYMYHPDDIDSYVETIKELFEQPDEVTRIGENAINTIAHKFDIHSIVNQNEEFYHKLISL